MKLVSLLCWPIVAFYLNAAEDAKPARATPPSNMQAALSPPQWRGEERQDKPTPARLIEALPAPAYWLFQWPEPAALTGPKRVDAGALKIAAPARQAREWSEKVLNPAWQPPANTELFLLRDEFHGRDTARMQWGKDGLRIRASQTASVFALELTPLDGTKLGEDPKEKYATAKKLCSQLFAQEGFHWGAEPGDRIPIPDLARRITAYSFRPDSFKELKNEGSIIGWAETLEEKGVYAAKNDAAAVRERHSDTEEWVNTELAWRYWFRNVNWFNDGKSVGFYFLKIEEGPWSPSYDDANRDKKWLR